MKFKSAEPFGKYLLLEKIAAGGMAEVYLAKSSGAEGIGRFFAIKRILPQFSDNADFIDMFKEEAKIAMNLSHGNVVSIFEFGVEKGQFYLVMEFVEGQNLRQVLNHLQKTGRKLSLEQTIYVIKEVAAGLDQAHRCLDKTTGKPLNIIHRDMSPQNIMISFEGEVKIVDFGIAKAETQLEQTRAGTIKGKYGYMSPEQAEGQNTDPRTDIFSLGIIMWELLAHERLFTAQNEVAVLKKIRECNIPSLRKLNPAIPAELEKIVLKALCKDKTLRYQSSGLLHKDLNRFLNTQYPDFAGQDFSLFMKSSYSEMFLANRKKLSYFAKFSVPTENSVSITESITSAQRNLADAEEKKSRQEHNPVGDMIEKTVSQQVDLSHLKITTIKSSTDLRSPSSVSSSSLSTGTSSVAGPRNPQRPQNNSRPRPGTTSSVTINFGWLPPLLFAVSVAYGAYTLWEQPTLISRFLPSGIAPTAAPLNPADGSGSTTQSDSMSSIQRVPLNIQSFPQGAKVVIDEELKGITPLSLDLPANKVFRVSIVKEGYLPFERTAEKVTAPNYTLKATLLPEPPMGFVTIELKNGPRDTIVKINDVRVNDQSNLIRYKIPAGVPVRIEASHPLSGFAAEQVVTVGQGQSKVINFDINGKTQRRSE